MPTNDPGAFWRFQEVRCGGRRANAVCVSRDADERPNERRNIMKCILISALVFSLAACASVSSENPAQSRIEAQAKENDRVADMWQKAGNSETSRVYRDKADQDRAEKARTSYGFADALVDAIFGALEKDAGKVPRK
jgi:hypothetical protein